MFRANTGRRMRYITMVFFAEAEFGNAFVELFNCLLLRSFTVDTFGNTQQGF